MITDVIIIAPILIIVAFFVGRKFASKPIEDKNNEIRRTCDKLHKEEVELESRIKDLHSDAKWMEEELHAAEVRQSELQEQYEEKLEVIKNTKKLAEEAYQAKSQNLEMEFQKQKETLQQNILEMKKDLDKVQNELEALKSTKAAAIRAARKEQEIKENQTFYTLQITGNELQDIKILEETKMKISKPRAISMVIWTAYYQQIAKVKFPKILGKQNVCGIYKITNIKTGECYIGQSKDVRKRWYEHVKAGLGIDTPVGNKLYAAMLLQGIHNFSFELLEECQPQDLDKKEKYFISLYNADSLGYNGNAGRS